MLKAITQFLKKRKLNSDNEDRIRGYNYAAGQLLKSGDMIVDRLEDESSCGFDRTKFDAGMQEALTDYSSNRIISI